MKNDPDRLVKVIIEILEERAAEREELAGDGMCSLEDFNKHTREAMKCRIAIKRIKENGL